MRLHFLPAIFSSLFRLISYIFLQIIPTRLAVPALPLLYFSYLISLISCPLKNSQKLIPDPKPVTIDSKEQEGNSVSPERKAFIIHCPDTAPSSKARNISPLSAVLFSLKTHEYLPNAINVAINTLLLLASIDLALNPVLYPDTDVVFTRVGAVYPDAAKITLRYPPTEALGNDTYQNLQILFREADSYSSPKGWKDGPVAFVQKDNDWVTTVKLDKLWPDTSYEYVFSTLNRTLLPYPSSPIRFRTFPDPRLNAGSRFKFVVSSCITPNFPYQGPHHRQTIKGFDLLARYLKAGKPIAQPGSNERETTTNTSSQTTEETNATNAILPDSQLPSEPFSHLFKFMLFLGDFIYADVPIYFGSDQDAYSRLYRRNYASPSFRKIYEHLPMLHVYDDHEIINNFGGQGVDIAPYVNATYSFKLYNGAANYDSPKLGEHYFNFTYGDTAFFVMDTRRHRSNVDLTEPAARTMLGESQVESLHNWLSKVNNTATFKFIISSVPFTSLWQHDAVKDSWGGYEAEKATILDALHSVPNVIILSGDRHEFAAIEFAASDPQLHVVREFSTSPLNMFYIPFVHTLKMESQEVVDQVKTEITLTDSGPSIRTHDEAVPKERVLKYLPIGTSKWSSIEIDTRNRSRPILHLETIIDGNHAYELEIMGTPLEQPPSKALISVPSSIKQLLEKIGFRSKQWF